MYSILLRTTLVIVAIFNPITAQNVDEDHFEDWYRHQDYSKLAHDFRRFVDYFFGLDEFDYYMHRDLDNDDDRRGYEDDFDRGGHDDRLYDSVRDNEFHDHDHESKHNPSMDSNKRIKRDASERHEAFSQLIRDIRKFIDYLFAFEKHDDKYDDSKDSDKRIKRDAVDRHQDLLQLVLDFRRFVYYLFAFDQYDYNTDRDFDTHDHRIHDDDTDEEKYSDDRYDFDDRFSYHDHDGKHGDSMDSDKRTKREAFSFFKRFGRHGHQWNHHHRHHRHHYFHCEFEMFSNCTGWCDQLRATHDELMRNHTIGMHDCRGDSYRDCHQKEMKIVRCATDDPPADCKKQVDDYLNGATTYCDEKKQ